MDFQRGFNDGVVLLMGTKTPKTILYGAPIGVLLGLLAGYYQPELLKSLGFLGQLFINSLRIVIIPLVIATVVVGIGNLGNGRRVGRTIGATLIYFVATTIIAIVIGVSLAGVVGPGVGVESEAMRPPQQVMQARHLPVGDVLSTLIPGNHFMTVASGRYFVVFLFALLFGAVLATMGHRRRLTVDLFRAISEALQKLVRWLLWAAPVGLFCLVGAQVAEHPTVMEELVGDMGMFALAVLIGLAVHGLVVLPLILKYFGNRQPLEYLGKMVPALSTAFASDSPVATLPVTHQCVVGDSRVDNRAASAVLPLGATMNSGGTIIFVMIAVFFVAQSLSLELTVGQVLIMTLAALVASFGLAGVPGAGLLILTIAFEMADLPEAAYGMLALVAAVEWLIHRGCTVVNVWSDAVGASVIAVRVNASLARRPKPAGRSRTSSDRERGSSRRDDRGGRPRRTDDRFDRKRPDGNRGRSPQEDRSGSRSSRPDRERRDRSERPVPQANLHRADDDSSPFAIKQDNVVDLDGRPERPPAKAESPRGRQRPRRDQQRSDSSSRTRERRDNRGRPDRPQRSEATDSGRRAQGASSRDTRGAGDSRRRDSRATAGSPTERRSSRPQASSGSVDLPDTSTLDREQARVEAQLAEMKKREQQTKARSQQPTSSTPEPVATPPEDPIESPRIDYSTGDVAAPVSKPDQPDPTAAEKAVSPGEEPERKKEAEPAKSEATAQTSGDDKPKPDTETEPKPPVSFGRRRKTRGPRPDSKPKSESDKEGSGDSADSPDYETVTVQATSFGRSRKKRTR